MENNLTIQLLGDRNRKARVSDPYPTVTQYEVFAVIKFNKDIDKNWGDSL